MIRLLIRKKNQQVLEKKRESIEKIKRTSSEGFIQPEMKKLLSGMSKDLEVRNMETTKLEQIFLRDITVHQGKFYMILQNWVQPFLQEISALMTQLDRPNNIQSEIRTENLRKNHKIDKNAQHDLLCGDPMSPTSPEIREIVKTRGEEFERSQSPYSIALVPQINSKITKRPPRPQSKNLIQMEGNFYQ